LKLQAVNLCFDLTLIPLRRESGTHRVVIAVNPPSKALEFGNATAFGLCEPFIQILPSVLLEHRDKRLAELVGRIQITVSHPDLFNVLALLLIELAGLTDTQPGCSAR
jgi:hypothetical protein